MVVSGQDNAAKKKIEQYWGISDASEPHSGVVERLERLSDLDQIRVRFRIWMLCDEEAAVATIALVWWTRRHLT